MTPKERLENLLRPHLKSTGVQSSDLGWINKMPDVEGIAQAIEDMIIAAVGAHRETDHEVTT